MTVMMKKTIWLIIAGAMVGSLLALDPPRVVMTGDDISPLKFERPDRYGSFTGGGGGAATGTVTYTVGGGGGGASGPPTLTVGQIYSVKVGQ